MKKGMQLQPPALHNGVSIILNRNEKRYATATRMREIWVVLGLNRNEKRYATATQNIHKKRLGLLNRNEKRYATATRLPVCR